VVGRDACCRGSRVGYLVAIRDAVRRSGSSFELTLVRPLPAEVLVDEGVGAVDADGARRASTTCGRSRPRDAGILIALKGSIKAARQTQAELFARKSPEKDD